MTRPPWEDPPEPDEKPKPERGPGIPTGDLPSTDGGVTEDDLREATDDFFDDGDVESVDYSPENDSGMVVVNVEEVDASPGDDGFDVNDFDEHLATYGFHYTGYIPAPGMTQINVASYDGGDE